MELAVRVDDAVDLAILEGVRAAGARDEGTQGVGHDEPAGGPVPALDRPLGDHGDLSRMFRVVATLQLLQHGIEIANLVEEVAVDGFVDLPTDFVHELGGRSHLVDIDEVSVRYLCGILLQRLIGEEIGPVVQDAFRGHEEIHGEVLSAANGGDGTDPVTAIDR